VVPRVAAILSPADFHDPRHATLWESVLSIHRRGDHVDVVTVAAELRARDRLNAIGGPPYIGSLTDEIPTLAHCEAHARIVLDLARHRRAVEAYRAATSRLLNGAPLESVQAEVGLLLRGAQSVSPVGRVADDLDDLLDAMWAAREGQRAPVTTPWAAVNGVLGGRTFN
jgi:replicative DNA helicase